MLADRFNLKVRHETKELPVYALVVANRGPKLASTKLPPLPPVGEKPSEGTKAGPKFRGIRLMGLGHLEGSAATTGLLTDVLTHKLERLVVDDTGLKGNMISPSSGPRTGRRKPVLWRPQEAIPAWAGPVLLNPPDGQFLRPSRNSLG